MNGKGDWRRVYGYPSNTDDDIIPECEFEPAVIKKWLDKGGCNIMKGVQHQPGSLCNRWAKRFGDDDRENWDTSGASLFHPSLMFSNERDKEYE